MVSRVLFISPRAEDAVCIERMLSGTSLVLDHAASLAAARVLLARNRYGAVLTESALPDGGWLDVLEEVRRAGPAPDVIVTRPVVDARFWAEVLNLGGYDMLAQPFSEEEVRHVLENACSRIQHDCSLTAAAR